MNSPEEVLEAHIAYPYIATLGDFFEVRNQPEVQLPKRIKWQVYGKNHPEQKRWGAALTRHPTLEIDSLDSIAEYNRLNGVKITDAEFTKVTPLGEKFEICKGWDLGRSHIIKMEQGGFFTFHRDLDPWAFRLVHTIDCDPNQFVWIHDKKVLPMENNKTYYANTKLPHAVFAMRECTFIILSCLFSRRNINKLNHCAGAI